MRHRHWFSLLPLLAALAVAPAAQADHWTRGPDTDLPRSQSTEVTLHDGSVLIIGGVVLDQNAQSPISSTVLRYDPSTGGLAHVADMDIVRSSAVAITLADGRVLVAGGSQGQTHLTSAEVYDPTTNEWTLVTNELSLARDSGVPSASLLHDGRVLFASSDGSSPSNVVEVYTPATNAFSTVKPLNHARGDEAQTLLADGRVLVAGGADNSGPVNTGEVYDPVSDTWTDTANDLTELHVAPLLKTLQNGQALIGGGETIAADSSPAPSTSSELYNPATNSFTPTGQLNSAHFGGISALLADGRVLAATGTDHPDTLAANDITETYSPTTGTWTRGARTEQNWDLASAAVLPDGRVFVCCGIDSGSLFGKVTQIYTPSTLPSAPQSVSAAAAGDGAATVTWKKPASDGDNPILDYTVTASTGQTATTPDDGRWITVTGLADGQPVTFTVTARTAFGTSPASAPSAAVTPVAPPDTTAPTVKITGLKHKLTRKALLKGLKFTVTPSEPASLAITLLGPKKLASKSSKLGGPLKVTLKPKRTLLSKAKKFSVKLRVLATDAAGNKRTVTVVIRVSG